MGMGVAAAERNYTGRNYGHTGKQDPAAEKVRSRGAQEEDKTRRTAAAADIARINLINNDALSVN